MCVGIGKRLWVPGGGEAGQVFPQLSSGNTSTHLSLALLLPSPPQHSPSLLLNHPSPSSLWAPSHLFLGDWPHPALLLLPTPPCLLLLLTPTSHLPNTFQGLLGREPTSWKSNVPWSPSRPILTSPTLRWREGGRETWGGGGSYFGARTPSAQRPTPRPTLCVGVGGGRETWEGHDPLPHTFMALGLGRSQPTRTQAFWALLFENSSSGRPWAARVEVDRRSTLTEL